MCFKIRFYLNLLNKILIRSSSKFFLNLFFLNTNLNLLYTHFLTIHTYLNHLKLKIKVLSSSFQLLYVSLSCLLFIFGLNCILFY